MEASLQEILDAREQRVQKIVNLLNTYQKPVLSFTMNIPGPVKLDRDVSIGFFVGNRMIKDAFGGHIVCFEICRKHTGCEGYYVLDMDAVSAKQIAMDLEDTHPIGRLFDMDITDPDGKKLERSQMGAPVRKCLICENDAFLCARSRAHSLPELQDRTGFYLYLAARQWLAEWIAACAYLALQQEVSTTPKPGLVDRSNHGAHTDMGIRHFFVSANALRPFFCRMAETGYLTRDDDPKETFRKIRVIGMEAESAMLKATGGVNTHKGAIFSLGLLCAAAGRLDPALWSIDSLLSQCAQMTQGVVAEDFAGITPENAKTAGEKIYARYGIGGVRQQAEAGFPGVKNAGLSVLQQALENGLSMNDACAVTLLHLLSVTDDTNLIHRGGRQVQLQVKAQIADLLKQDPFPSMETIAALDQDFISRNLSAGGSADLLALTCLLYFLLGA